MPFLLIPVGLLIWLLAPLIAFSFTLVVIFSVILVVLNLIAIAWLAPAELLLRAFGFCNYFFDAGGWYGGPTGGVYDAAFYSWLAWIGSTLCWIAAAYAFNFLFETPAEKRARKQARAFRNDPIARASALLAADLAPREPAYRCVITPPVSYHQEFVAYDENGCYVEEGGDERWTPKSRDIPSFSQRVLLGLNVMERGGDRRRPPDRRGRGRLWHRLRRDPGDHPPPLSLAAKRRREPQPATST